MTGVAIALTAWAQHLEWTAAPATAVPAALFGLGAALKIQSKEAGILDAARALRRAFAGDRNRVGADTAMPDAPVARAPPGAAGTIAGSANVPETHECAADVIMAESRDATQAALREAFDAGKAQKAQELKAVIADFLESLVTGDEASLPDPSPPQRPTLGASEAGDPRQTPS